MLATALLAASPAWANTDDVALAAYVKARAADAAGAAHDAAAGYAAALGAMPGNRDVALRAYREALEAGDDALAIRAANILAAGDDAPDDVALFRIAVAARDGDMASIEPALTKLKGTPFAFIAGPVRAWQAFVMGNDPLPFVEPGKGANALEAGYDAESRALLEIALGKIDDASATLQMLLVADPASIDLRCNAAQALAAQGKADLGQALLQGDNPILAACAAGLGGGVKPSFAFGVSRLFTRLGSDLSNGKVSTLAIVVDRAALIAEPGNDRARLLLAGAIAQDGAPDYATATLAAIGPGHSLHDVAEDERIAVLQGSDDPQALAAARKRAAAPGATAADARQLGMLLSAAGDNSHAAAAFALALKRAGRDAEWTYHLQLGGALEQAGRWPEGRAELKRALALAPDEPLALNYLGYADIEHGEAFAPALKLLERAHSLAPDNGSITDSLGWALYRSGDTQRALPLLEEAAVAEPANTTISEHLGDAYWALGRRYEARYAWAAARVSADTADAARLTRKIADGPGPRTAEAH